VALLVTGNELVTPGTKLKPGQIFNSNRWMLKAALNESGIDPIFISDILDRPVVLKRKIQKTLSDCDLLLLVGGVSVGDTDFSKSILESLGVKRVFWRVSQKPGYPLYFGKRKGTLVFGLPGNPASAWVNFYEYVLPCLRALQGLPSENSSKKARLISEGPNRGFKTLFLKAQFNPEIPVPEVTLLKGQGSHLLQSLAESNCLAVSPPGKGRLKKGEMLEIHPFPSGKNL
jgi:molybdopterin molybdotransferase